MRLTWDNESKNWLLTAFEKKNSAFDNTTDTGETLKEGKQNDTATLQNTVSESKDTTTEPKKQEVAQENLQPTPQSTAEEQMEVSPVENKDAEKKTAPESSSAVAKLSELSRSGYSSGFITTRAELPLLTIFEARALICSLLIPSTASL